MAAPDTTNPYAAPTDPSGPAAASHLWQIEGIGLLVSDGAVLPEIDLEFGIGGPALVEVRRKFTKAHWSTGFMGLFALMFQLIPRPLRSWDGHAFWVSLIVFFGVWLGLYLLIFLTLNRRVRFTTYVDPAAEARRKRNRNICGVIYTVSMAFVILPLLVLVFHPHLSALPDTWILVVILGVIGMIACAYWQYQTRPRIHMTLEANGWLRLGGVHPDAIRRLEEWKEDHRETP